MKLTRFEEARIIGARALQIKMGAPVLSKPGGAIDPLKIAMAEYTNGLTPIKVVREDKNNST
ncbi:MAG: DNA-directed RNA polymerase subunit K [Thermoplasmata archaeon]